ncbi:MAG: OsmC family protein [Myxococcales bacterium]|nr:OsmC family protein [Myxococcales bacterium]
MVDIHIGYTGELRCEAKHGPSAAVFHTDAPKDNHGKGESFSPTDLVATGLGTCMITVMGILARSRGYDLGGTRIHVKKHMTASPPRRIARLEVTLSIPDQVAANLDGQQRLDLEEAAHTCPVRLSLLPAIEVPVSFSWG